MEREIKIPQAQAFICTTCGTTGVASAGSQLLCQNCVNSFLARNVGYMQPVVIPAVQEDPEPEHTAEPGEENVAEEDDAEAEPAMNNVEKGGTG